MSVIALEATNYSGNYIWTAREKMVSAKVKSREELLDTHRGTKGPGGLVVQSPLLFLWVTFLLHQRIHHLTFKTASGGYRKG